MAKGINRRGMMANGRRAPKGEQFVRALHAIYDHPDYLALNKTTRAFLWDVARLYNGHNNGNLSIAESIMRPMGWDKKTIRRCRDELVERGWLAITRLPRAKRQPILYRLTWLDVDHSGRPELDHGAYVARRKLRAE